MTTQNEAAERLRKMMRLNQMPMDWLADALAAERRATVERIRERFQREADEPVIGLMFSTAFAILDEEAAR